jgi:hypothetical protein
MGLRAHWDACSRRAALAAQNAPAGTARAGNRAQTDEYERLFEMYIQM